MCRHRRKLRRMPECRRLGVVWHARTPAMLQPCSTFSLTPVGGLSYHPHSPGLIFVEPCGLQVRLRLRKVGCGKEGLLALVQRKQFVVDLDLANNPIGASKSKIVYLYM